MIDLHIIRMVLNARAVHRLVSRQHGVGHHVPDEGVALHAGLANLFATSSEHAAVPTQPFAVDDIASARFSDPEKIFLLAYSQFSEGELLKRMGPMRNELLVSIASREVPPIEAGSLIDFRVRVCPTVRTKRPEPGETERRTKERELDAWLADRFHTWREKPPSQSEDDGFDVHADRERVYGAWLARELEAPRADVKPKPILDRPGELVAREGVARAVRMVEFRRERFHRDVPKTPKSKGGPAQRPNAVLEGTLRVTDTAAFRALLARGIGRHRAFGFGMLLVRRAG